LFTQTERLIAVRNLRPKRKQGFLKIISLFSFLGIMLGVAILIIVMSVMNGFRSDLTEKIIGLNPHLIIQFNNEKDLENTKKILFVRSDLKPFITDITIIKIATPNIIPKKENAEITFKKPSFLLGRKFLNEISLSAFVNNLFIFKLRFNFF